MNVQNKSEAQRSNGAVVLSYAILDTILVLCYLVELVKKARTIGYFTIFSLLALIPLGLSLYLFAKDREHSKIRYVVACGFTVFYLFVIFTTVSPVAYVYAMVLALVLLVYNELRLSIGFTISIAVGNIVQVAVMAFNGQIAKEDMANVEIRIGSIILFSLFMNIGTRVMLMNNQMKMEAITKEKENTARLMDELVGASGKITDSIEVVSGKMELLQNSTMKTMMSMQDVAQGTNDTAVSIQAQMEKTEEIQKTICNVKESSEIIEHSIDHTKDELERAQQNIDRLIRHVSASNEENAHVSSELSVLSEYTNQMQSIIQMIDDITSQTSLLSLNASIEAARAGEAGRGFAVVATEISTLATQTQNATEHITVLIENVSDELNKVVKVIEKMIDNINAQNVVANDTAQSFKEITHSAEAVYKESSYLKELVEELTNANHFIVEGIETISAATEEVTAHSNETYQNSSENSDITNEVGMIIEDLNQMAQELVSHV